MTPIPTLSLRLLFLSLLFGLPGAPVAGQVIDSTFRGGRIAANPLDLGLVQALAADSVDRLLVGGGFNFIGRRGHGGIQRLLPNGQVDSSFNVGGTGANGQVAVIEATAGGRWLIGGTFSRYDGRPVGRVARLLPDGALDASFNPGGSGADGQVLTITHDARGYLLLGGDFTRFNGRPADGLVRLRPDGTPDTTFVAAPFRNGGAVYALTVDVIGRVLVAGYFPPITASGTVACLYRLWANGQLDSTFQVGAGFRSLGFPAVGRQVVALPSGKVLLGGSFNYYNRIPRSGLMRFHDDGTLDTTLALPLLLDHIAVLRMLAPGQILVGGGDLPPGFQGRGWLFVLGANDSLSSGFVPSASVRAVASGPAGKWVVGLPRTVERLKADGFPDYTFRLGGSAGGLACYRRIAGLARQRNGRLIVVDTYRYGAISYSTALTATRLFADGSTDASFSPMLAMPSSSARNPNVVTVDAADRILIADVGHVGRMLPNGQQDTGFNDGAGGTTNGGILRSNLTRVTALPDGRLLVSGEFDEYGHVSRTGLVRLTAQGRVDGRFRPPVVPGFFGRDVQLLPDGTVLTLYDDGGETSRAYWLDSVGAPLPTFNGGQPLDGVTALTALSDTTVLLGGRFTLGGVRYQGTYKLTRTGTPAPGFVPDPALDGQAVRCWPQPDGRLLFFDDVAHGHRLRRLLRTGAVDSSFAATEFGTGFPDESATALLIQSGGKLVVSGAFLTVNGEWRPSLVQLTDVVTGRPPEAAARAAFQLFPNPAHDHFTLRRPTAEAATATLLDVLGRPVRQWPLAPAAETRLSVAGVPAGAYVVRVVGTTGVLTRRVVVE